MESLLCDEVWPMGPDDHKHHELDEQCNVEISYSSSFYTCKEDCIKAFSICLEKECIYMPQPNYVDHLKSYNLIAARFVAIQWLIKAQRRLNLSVGTVFNAANYLDRFISMNQCHEWKKWMFELLCVACLSVASKFGETAPPPFHEIQMEDLDHTFQSSMIQKVELTLLKALEWQLRATTAYSYIELLIHNYFDSLKPPLLEKLTTRVIDLLLSALLDFKFLEFRPCIVAISAIKCIFEELLLPSISDAILSKIANLIPQHQKDNLLKCHKIMEERLLDPLFNSIACWGPYYCPSSPVTVLTTEWPLIYDWKFDLTLSRMPSGLQTTDLRSTKKKREREEF